MTDADARRRAIDHKQAQLAAMIEPLGCEGVMLFQPAHVAWFTGGMAARGLLADTERPGVYTNGRQRWLVASNLDSQRLFRDELDGLGFQLKEWNWSAGRAALLAELFVNRKIAADRAFANLPAINEALRLPLRQLIPREVAQLQQLGATVAHALEATARSCRPGETEAELAGQVAHRLIRRGAEVVALTVQADGRDADEGRAGYGTEPVQAFCRLQVTATQAGLHATAARTVHFGPPTAEFRRDWDHAVRLAALVRSYTEVSATAANATTAGRAMLADTPYEFAWRDAATCVGTGWLPAEELRRLGHDEPFTVGQSLVWQAKLGRAAVVDTDCLTDAGPTAATPAAGWPVKRVTVRGKVVDVPDALVRAGATMTEP